MDSSKSAKAIKAAKEPSSRGQQRLRKIIEAATAQFLKVGYDQTSIDTIVELSGGSKATVYSYFPTKADLFRAVVDAVVSEVPEPHLDTSEDIRSELIEFGVERLRLISSERHRALLRLVIAERERFPELAKLYFEQGPERRRDTLATYLMALKCERGNPLDAPEELADFFMAMLLHSWCQQLLLLAQPTPRETKIRRHVERIVDRFLFAFRVDARLSNPIFIDTP